jgi:acetyltransferase-like isoleucine patch superfamily enzyme
VGKGTYFTDEHPQVDDWAGSSVTIGNYCSIAPGVRFISGGEHHIEYVTTSPFGRPAVSRGPIIVGSDVWIGANALILSGVQIGHGAVVGAGSVVTKDVRPYEIVAGVPAKHLRFRFNQDQIRRLLHVRWWDWPDQRIQEHEHLLCSPDIERFLNEAPRPDSPDQTGES